MSSCDTLPRTPANPRSGLFVRILRLIVYGGALARQRRALNRLDALRLADIGVTGEAARREAARPVWDAPAHWRTSDGA